MAKLRPDPVSASDFIDFLNNYSDFSFEIRVLNALVARGFECEHGGTYDDPVTKKPRQFDIRASRVLGRQFLRFAVECKNLRPYFPLLITCLPRRDEESYHEVVYSVDPDKHPFDLPDGPYAPAMLPHSKSVRIVGEASLYPHGKPVGKSCDQVGRLPSGELTTTDSEIYDKWAQALSSADDLTFFACRDGKERSDGRALSVVIPVVVVPEGRLWVAQYDSDGNRTADPAMVDRCSYFVGRSYFHRSLGAGDEMTISHLEFVTFRGLGPFIDELCGTKDTLERTFSTQRVVEQIES